MSTPTVNLRPSRAARTYVVVFTVVWCLLAGTTVVRAGLRGSPTAVVAPAMLGVGAGLGWRIGRLGATAEGDRLTVRNVWGTRVLRRSEVEDVRTGPTGTGGGIPIGTRGIPIGSGVLLLLRDGTVLPVQGARNGLPLLGHAAQDAQVDQLRAWLRAG